MVHFRFLPILPVAAVVAAFSLAACERQVGPGGDPRVDGIIQHTLPEPDLSILSDQRSGRPSARPAPAPAVPASTAATTTAPAATPETPAVPAAPAPGEAPEAPAATPAAPPA